MVLPKKPAKPKPTPTVTVTATPSPGGQNAPVDGPADGQVNEQE